MKLGLIYKIVSPSIDKIYVGSTVKTLEMRLDEHEKDYGCWLYRGCRSGYLTSFEILKYGDYKIELIEEVYYPSSLLNREIFHINDNECVNMIHNKRVILEKIKCVCCMDILCVERYKHCRTTKHRKIIRSFHKEGNNRLHFINIYNYNRPIVTYEPGLSITIA